MPFERKVKINYKHPVDAEQWNVLATKNGNLIQSTYFDEVQDFYNQIPIYFEVFKEDRLICGVKLYFWASKKNRFIRAISKSLTQFGELIFDETYKSELLELNKLLSGAASEFIKDNRIVKVTLNGFYGDTELLLNLDFKPVSFFRFNVAHVDLNRKNETILKSFNRNTRRNILKAEGCNLEFIPNASIDSFLKVEKTVFEQQKRTPPNLEYIKHAYNALNKYNLVYVSLVNSDSTALSAAFFIILGDAAYSNFGGAVKNNEGAGQFIYYSLMKEFKKRGIGKFYFGQVAREVNQYNKKFSVGISTFKRGFRCIETESFKATYITDKLRGTLWTILLKILRRNR